MGDENLSERRLTVLLGTAAHRILTLAEHQEALSIAEQLATRCAEWKAHEASTSRLHMAAEDELRDAEARVKELVERRNRLIQEKYEAEARCERMRGIIDSHTCPAKNHPDVSCHICDQLAALDTDTTAGDLSTFGTAGVSVKPSEQATNDLGEGKS